MTSRPSGAVRPATLAVLIASIFLALAGTAKAQIVFLRSGAIWAMNDDGSGQRQLITASQTPGIPAPAAITEPDVFQNGGQGVVFQGVDNALNNGCGQWCGGVYLLSNGAVERVSPPAQSYVDHVSLTQTPRVTEDGQVAYDYEFDAAYLSDSIGTITLSGQPGTTWNTPQGENVDLPTPNPADADEMAWESGGDINISNPDGSSDNWVLTDNNGIGGLSWSSDGSELLVTDGAGIWVYDVATQTLTQPFTSAGAGQARFMGTSGIVFDYYSGPNDSTTNIYTIPTSCNQCTISDATALTTDGASQDPAWTSATSPILAFGQSPTPPPGGGSNGGSPGGPGTGGGGSNGGGSPGTTAGCLVPRLKGLTLARAKAALSKANCRVGKVTRRRIHGVRRGRVGKSSPGAGAHLAAGARVALVIAR